MEENLNNLVDFFKCDLEIKRILYNVRPKEEYKYNRESLIEYSDKLFEALNDSEYYFIRILNLFKNTYSLGNYEGYIKKFITVLKEELIKCGYDYNKLESFYEIYFSNMRESFVDKVADNCIGYTWRHIGIDEGKSINEILHVMHKTITNNENNYQNLPVISRKENIEEYPVTLYGYENDISKKLYEAFPFELSSGNVDIVSISESKILIMVRDRGHALSIEIEKENDRYYVRYFIPKICNIIMVNNLKGVDKVDNNSKYTVGVFETSKEMLPKDVVDFISKVPMDEHMFIEGGRFYNYEYESIEDNSMQK